MLGFRLLDRVLRGELPVGPWLLDRAAFPLTPLVRVDLLLAATYGICMGVYGLFRPGDPEYRQMLASTAKVPALFALTLLVTFPSLYVFNTLLGSRLRFGDLARLVVSALAVPTAVLAAFGPIVAFFSVSTTSYPFVVLMNVVIFAVSGGFGMAFLYRALTRPAPARPIESEPDAELLPEPIGIGGNAVFYVWMVVFGIVGGQMGWVLRPFIGNQSEPFAWFRPRESSFVAAVARTIRSLIGG